MRYILIVMLQALLAGPAAAGLLDGGSGGEGFGLSTIKPAAGTFLAYALPTRPLYKGLREAKFAAGIFKFEAEEGGGSVYKPYLKQSLPGSGGALGAVYGLSAHWGVTALVAYARSDGEFSKSALYALTYPAQPVNGKDEQSNFTSAINLVWDPFSGENFRFPIMLGLSYSNISQKAEIPISFQATSPVNRSGHVGSASDEINVHELGFSIGLAPQFNTGPIRWVPFLVGISPLTDAEHTYTERDFTTGEVAKQKFKSDETGADGGGVQVIFRPWNLTYTYMIPMLTDIKKSEGEKLSIHTLSFSRKF